MAAEERVKKDLNIFDDSVQLVFYVETQGYTSSFTMEANSRSNLFLWLKAGRVGVCHLFIRLLVSQFMFARNQFDPFIGTVIQKILFDAL